MKRFDQKMQSLSVGKMSATALAVGTGLGIVGAAEAGMVYGSVNTSLVPYGTTESFTLDINSDGVDDFTFSAFFSPQGYIPGYYSPGYEGPYGYYPGFYYPGQPIQHFGDSSVVGLGNNKVTANGPLALGSTIDQTRTDFASGSELGNLGYYADFGLWSEYEEGYLGLQFEVNGLNHYGWIRLGIDYNSKLDIFDFAYSDVPITGVNAGIVPLPSMAPLFALATGAMGVLGFRRNRREDRKKAESA